MQYPILKRRNPFLVWLFGVITFGIYTLVWMAKMCREVEEVIPRHPKNVAGSSAVLSTLFGGFTLMIWPLVVFLRFGESVATEQRSLGLQASYSNGLAVLFYFLAGTHVCYVQTQQNKIVDAVAARAGAGSVPPAVAAVAG